jgi:thiol-disulfide isomerase/thioredoxin
MSATAARTPVRLEVLKFSADWCGTCRLIDPVLVRVLEGFEGVELTRVDVGKDERLAAEMGVKGLPTLVMRTPDGRVLGRMTGSMNGKSIEASVGMALSQAADGKALPPTMNG